MIMMWFSYLISDIATKSSQSLCCVGVKPANGMCGASADALVTELRRRSCKHAKNINGDSYMYSHIGCVCLSANDCLAASHDSRVRRVVRRVAIVFGRTFTKEKVFADGMLCAHRQVILE